MLTGDEERKFIENNKKITELLKENEMILRRSGYNPPLTNYTLEQSEKIGVPSGYIRTVAAFNKKYHLQEICIKRTIRHNIIYALETSDLLNFIINRINIWGSVEAIFFKLSIVNFVSVIEAILLEATNNICCDASNCGETKKCKFHFSKEERNSARKAVEKLAQIGILDYGEEKIVRVKEIIDLRNRIHIRLAKGMEINLGDFNLDLYNEVVELLQDIDEQIYKNAVPHYNCSNVKITR